MSYTKNSRPLPIPSKKETKELKFKLITEDELNLKLKRLEIIKPVQEYLMDRNLIPPNWNGEALFVKIKNVEKDETLNVLHKPGFNEWYATRKLTFEDEEPKTIAKKLNNDLCCWCMLCGTESYIGGIEYNRIEKKFCLLH